MFNDILQYLPLSAAPGNLAQWAALLVTVLVYFSARQVYLKFGKTTFLQPMLVATPILIFLVSAANIPMADYNQGTKLLSWMITPLTIALMVPLARNFREIKRVLPAILFTLLICGCFTVLVTLAIAYLLGASEISLLSLTTKSVTTPVALIVSDEIRALPSLSALIVIVTGVLGVLIAPIIFQLTGIKDERSKGVTLGLSAHIIGSTYAFEQGHRYAAFSVVSMSLMALISALLIPLFFYFWY